MDICTRASYTRMRVRVCVYACAEKEIKRISNGQGQGNL